ncbi:uncharacterized protein PHALS_05833 [Plasmopara halstedii]|uniref:Uncharacterized protein n=1 Tax=Plasmopara halstedii TaxID=4781 RepID=A0A0P1ABU8_PLAHL|nr:uncharacterized protein PHALS_05833 [Plasmopara halstedii]CEG37777.1 hypothetical protein PHALS_05833 [Plasmopara halstedii]|eukprot:XP_024574146.1 hypothetical protein PHALS_05833 [Plasmopara halstedii]
MRQTQDGSLEEFFHLELHIPLLSYVVKLIDKQTGVAEEIVRLFTANRNGGNLITWLGKIDDNSDQTIESFMKSLLESVETSKLAYRLLSMRYTDFNSVYEILRGSDSYYDLLMGGSHWLNYAAYICFNFIEHEAKSFSVVPNVLNLMRKRWIIEETVLKNSLSTKRAMLTATIDIPNFYFEGFSRLDFTEDQVRLLKAALQYADQTILVREALKANRQVSSFANKLGKKTVEDTFKLMLKNEELVQELQAVLLDNEAVQLLKKIMKEVNGVEAFLLRLPKRGAGITPKEFEVMTKLEGLIRDEDTFSVLKTAMKHADSLTMFKDALASEGRLKLVEDMLSSTELDSATILKGILDEENKVQLLKEAVKDDTRLKLFRSALEDKKGVKKFKSALEDKGVRKFRSALKYKKLKGELDAVLKDMNQVFFLRVAVKDQTRANLFRAALEDKEHMEEFLNVLNEQKLANVFRPMLNEKYQLEWLEKAVSTETVGEFTRRMDKRDQWMLIDEIIKYLDSIIEEKVNRKVKP